MTFGTDATSEGSSEVQPAGEAHPPLPADLYCPDCGYNLRGLTSRRCPECGLVLDFIESETPIIPWERRRELGRFRAYWQTVLMVMFHNKLFCRAAYRSVSYRDAQKFRWVCILHVLIPLLLMLPILKVFDAEVLADAVENFGAWFIVVIYVCFLLTLLALTGLPSYFFHPKSLSVEQQNRAVALSYYACAALAWTPGVFILFSAVPFIPQRHDVDLAALLLAGMAAVGVPAAWSSTLDGIARHTLRSVGAVLRVAVLVPPLWLVVGGLTLVGLPAAVYFVALVFYSLRGGGLSG